MSPARLWDVAYQGSDGQALADAVRSALRDRVLVTRDRREFGRALRIDRCAIVCLATLSEASMSWVLARLARRPGHRVILVTPLTDDNARALARYPLAQVPVVWAKEVATRLPESVARAVGGDPIVRLLEAAADARAAPPLVSGALRRVGEADPPFTSVRRLAEAMRVPPRTVWDHWHRCTGGVPRLKEVLEWVMLYRAAEQTRLGPLGMACHVDVDLRTLERVCVRRLGITLGDLRRRDPRLILEGLADSLSLSLSLSLLMARRYGWVGVPPPAPHTCAECRRVMRRLPWRGGRGESTVGQVSFFRRPQDSRTDGTR